MRRQGVRPSRVTYTAAVAGLNRPRYKEWGPKLEKLARLLHDRSWEGDGAGGEGRDGPSPEDFDSSIEALGDAGDAGGAACLLRVMRREGFHASPRAYRSVIYACARVGHLSEAMVLAKEMKSSSSAAVGAAAKGRTLSSASAAPSSLSPDPRQAVLGVGGGEGRKEKEGVAVGLAVGLGVGVEVEEKVGEGGGDGEGTGDIRMRVGEGEQQGKGVRVGEEGGVRVGVEVREGEGEEAGIGEGRRKGEGPVAGAVAEDDPEDGSEFDIEVVYNCIISNFARAATQSGTGGSGSINGNGRSMDVCEHRTGRLSRGTEDKRRAVGDRHRAAGARAGVGEGATMAVADTGPGGDGEGLVALLLGVTERAEGSLTDEGANGGVEVAAAEEAPPSVQP